MSRIVELRRPVRRWIKFNGEFWHVELTLSGVRMKVRGRRRTTAIVRTWQEVASDPHAEIPLFTKELF